MNWKIWDLNASTYQALGSKPQELMTLSTKCTSSSEEQTSLAIKTNEESTNNDLNDIIDIFEDSTIFSITSFDFYPTDHLPLVNPQLID